MAGSKILVATCYPNLYNFCFRINSIQFLLSSYRWMFFQTLKHHLMIVKMQSVLKPESNQLSEPIKVESRPSNMVDRLSCSDTEDIEGNEVIESMVLQGEFRGLILQHLPASMELNKKMTEKSSEYQTKKEILETHTICFKNYTSPKVMFTMRMTSRGD